eukprot:jgi/Astpho2/9889/fgenesh1_pg.00152_%23_12_t
MRRQLCLLLLLQLLGNAFAMDKAAIATSEAQQKEQQTSKAHEQSPDLNPEMMAIVKEGIQEAQDKVDAAVKKSGRRKYPVSREDIVAAMPVDLAHLALARASRSWRKGMRTFVAGNTPPSDTQVEEGKRFNETWSFYPDDVPLRSMYGGDSRAALVPYLAHKALGDSYKWLLYGDDDTVWFMDSVQKVLEDLDPELPYFITDHMWWASSPGRATHPNREAPRCLPCEFDDSEVNKSAAPFNAPKGCPCTAQLICDSDERGLFNEFCDMPKAPVATYSMHGGAGGIMSIGMMRAVTLDYMEKCVKSLYSTGGDAFISICTWQAGYAITDPGYSFFHPEVGSQFDPGPEDRMGVMMNLVRALDHHCDDLCQQSLDKMLTLHVRSRVFPQLEDAAQFIHAITGMYDVFQNTKRSKADRAVEQLAEVEAAARAAQVAAEEAKREAEEKVARSEEAVSSAAKNSEDPKQEIAVVQANQAAAAANQAAAQAQAVADAQDTAAAVALQNAAQQAVAKKNARHLSQRHHRGEE